MRLAPWPPPSGREPGRPSPPVGTTRSSELLGGGRLMKAIVYARYGPPDGLGLTAVPTPVPKDNEVLVRVAAVSLNRSDWETLRGTPLYSRIGGPFRPRHHILGSDIAGQVQAAGREATMFQPGQDVFGDILRHIGVVAQYLVAPQG